MISRNSPQKSVQIADRYESSNRVDANSSAQTVIRIPSQSALNLDSPKKATQQKSDDKYDKSAKFAGDSNRDAFFHFVQSTVRMPLKRSLFRFILIAVGCGLLVLYFAGSDISPKQTESDHTAPESKTSDGKSSSWWSWFSLSRLTDELKPNEAKTDPNILDTPSDHHSPSIQFEQEITKKKIDGHGDDKIFVPGTHLPKKFGFGKGYADSDGLAFTKKMMKHAWDNYVKYAFGYDDLRPVTKVGHNWLGSSGLAATIIDALDTLYLMDMKEEFNQGREFVLKKLDFNQPIMVSVFETNIRVVGGLLSAFELSGDSRFVKKAQECADRLMKAFDTKTGVPNGLVNLQTGVSTIQSWSSGAILAEFGSLHLELNYLSDVTNDQIYREKAMRGMNYILEKQKTHPGLYPTTINPDTGDWNSGAAYTIGALADSFYEYLLKTWLISDRKDNRFRQFYDESAAAIHQYLIRRSPEGYTYLTSGVPGLVDGRDMEHLTCFAGGMFALGALTKRDGNWQEMLDLGANLTETCYQTYHRQPTGIGAERTDIHSWQAIGKYYILRPEVLESIFYMWRATHDEKYRQWGREIMEAIEKYCRVEGGYAGLNDVSVVPPALSDNQESFFLAETLKYLWLLFSDDDVLPLEEYVLNTEAHPLRILGTKRRVMS